MKIKKLQLTLFVAVALNFQFLIQKAHAQVCFTPAVNFVVPTSPKSVTSADFNNDGKADLAITDSGNCVSIKLGNGTGGFGITTNFAVGSSSYSYPQSATSADFNGDGNADLATANAGGGAGNMSVLLGDGIGGLGSSVNFGVGANPYSVISADFNGDNKLDLVTANYMSNDVSILLGDGIGGFGSNTDFMVGANPYSVISSDFNGDGKTDLAVVNQAANNVSILLGNGLGGFGSAINFSVGSVPQSLISADFNGDSNIDLAVANYNSSDISVLLGNGSGSFSPAINFSVGSSPSSIAISDFNLDGKIDLVVNSVSVLLGNGSGGFGSASNFMVGTTPNSVTVADFNNDGNADIAVTNFDSNNVSILLNTSQPNITVNASSTTVCAGTSVTLSGDGAISYSWTGGVIDGFAFSPASTNAYTVTGTAAGGCLNTATITITVDPSPTATFTTQDESLSLSCDGSIKAHLSGGTGIIQAQWDSAQTVLALIDSIGGLCPGIYTLHLTDANSCTNTYTKAVQSGAMPHIPPICMITVDFTLTHTILVWEKTNLNMISIDSFIVYREISTNNYQRIGAVPKDSLTIFEDFTCNPATTGYRYKLKSKNIQGAESFFSDYHNTIYLTSTGANFSWTPYQVENNITPVSNYYIYRDDNSTGNFQTIGNTTGNQFGYTDVQFASFPNASYYVEAVMAGGACQPTRSDFTASRSNVKHFGIAGIQELNNHTVVNIYPNPAGNTLNITGITGKATVLLYDVVGKLVLEKEVENNTILNTSNLVDGIYTLLTESKMGRSFNKVVIRR